MHVLHIDNLPLRNVNMQTIMNDMENDIFKIYLFLSVGQQVLFNDAIPVNRKIGIDVNKILPPETSFINKILNIKNLTAEQVNNLIISKIITWFFFPVEAISLMKEFHFDEQFKMFINKTDEPIRHYLGMTYLKHFFPEIEFAIIGGYTNEEVRELPISFSTTILKGFNRVNDTDYYLQHDLFYKTPSTITLH